MRHASWFCVAAAMAALPVRAQEPARHPAADLGLLATIPWRSDGAEFYDNVRAGRADADRGKLIDDACAAAKAEHKLVLWYVHRIQENSLGGRQMYRAPVLDVYMQQVVFADRDVAALATNCFVPVRCVLDEPLAKRFSLRPLTFVEPAVVFLDGDGQVVHFVERIRTFHAQWFADLLVRVLDRFQVPRHATDAASMRDRGLWKEALATAQKAPEKDAAGWLLMAQLHRLLRQPDLALQCLDAADQQLAAPRAGGAGEGSEDGEGARERRPRRPTAAQRALRGDLLAERGLVLAMQGDRLAAQPVLEEAWRSGAPRAAEAGYWYALNALQLGDEVGAMRRFTIVAERHQGDVFGKRARANVLLGPDDRPVGAAFTGFESLAYLPASAYAGLPKDTTWCGGQLPPRALAEQAVRFLLAQQRDDGGFTDSRYAYWPSSEITPNVWVAVTALCLAALNEYRDLLPELAPRIDAALQRGEAFAFDPKRLNRGANEDCYSDAYRLLYLARRAAGTGDGAERQELVRRMNELVQAAASRQVAGGFWAHEYPNAFATGAVVQELVAARNAGATLPAEVADKAAAALLSARSKNGAFAYGGTAGDRLGSIKDSAGRMPLCEGSLLLLGHSDLDKLRFALANFWQHMDRIETVRRNDFHSDGELAGFFFFHSLFHASESVLLLPEDERQAHWDKFVAMLQRIPELDGSFVDSHELGRSYGTAMALLTLRNAATFE